MTAAGCARVATAWCVRITAAGRPRSAHRGWRGRGRGGGAQNEPLVELLRHLRPVRSRYERPGTATVAACVQMQMHIHACMCDVREHQACRNDRHRYRSRRARGAVNRSVYECLQTPDAGAELFRAHARSHSACANANAHEFMQQIERSPPHMLTVWPDGSITIVSATASPIPEQIFISTRAKVACITKSLRASYG